jgi:hypothetical protein
MESFTYKMACPNSPFAVGVCELFAQEYAQFKDKININNLTLSDRLECDVALQCLDIERNPYPHAKVIFSNCDVKSQLLSNQYVLPFLANSRGYPLFNVRSRKKKKYKCAAIHRDLHGPGNLREEITPFLMEICDFFMLNYKILKCYEEDKELDSHWNYRDILDMSEFVITPPGAQDDTCRYNEALLCNCIPLQMYYPDMEQFIKHPEEYSWTKESLDGYKLPPFREDVLSYLQKNIDPDYLVIKISEIINENINEINK